MLAGKVVPRIVEAGSITADNEVTGSVSVTYVPETNVKTVFGTNIVSCDTTPEIVVGEMVTAGTTLPGRVVVYVRVI